MQGRTHCKCLANQHLSCFSGGLRNKSKTIYRTKQESLGQDDAVDIAVL